MAKVALLIGTTDYEPGLTPLPGAQEDVLAMERVLRSAKLGDFDRVEVLNNPDPVAMQTAIETLFANCSKQDLALMYLSGHGIKDDNGRLYFATRITRKNVKGDLVKATAVPAHFIQGVMSDSRCKRQVVILDCCFSGAFAEGMTAKDDGKVDLETQLGGEGRAVLTSSSATQYSFEDETDNLSVYTRFVVEGIEKGVADTDNDGIVSVDELHEYASQKVQEVSPAMKPKIFAVEEGFKIRLAKAAIGDPKIRYRKEVEHFASRGAISTIGRYTLDALRAELNLSKDIADHIEAEVLQPYREYQEKLNRYEVALKQAVEREYPPSQMTQEDLERYQLILGLADEDVAPIRDRLLQALVIPNSTPPQTEAPLSQPTNTPLAPASVTKPAAESTAHPSVIQPSEPPTQSQSSDKPDNDSTKLPFILGGGLGAIALVIGIAVFSSVREAPQRIPSDLEHSDTEECICRKPEGCSIPGTNEDYPRGDGDTFHQDEIRGLEKEGFECMPYP